MRGQPATAAHFDRGCQLLWPEHPDYAEFLNSEFDEVVKSARGFVARLFKQALTRPPSAPADFTLPHELTGPGQALFEEIGRTHAQQGQDVTGLLAAYRVGATVAWRHIVIEATRRAVPAESLAALATALFAAVDQLSAASLRGYVRQEAASIHHRDQARERLLELLLSDRCDSATVAASAADAGWPLPEQAALVLFPRSPHHPDLSRPNLGRDCLWSRQAGLTIAVIPDPEGPGQRTRLATALRGLGAVVGESVSTARLPASLPRARSALTLRQRGVLQDDPLFVDQHLDTLIVHHDPALLHSLRLTVLAPLAPLPEPTRERLEQTLRCWLTHMGNRRAIAHELHIHPQTVRYRLAQLRELFESSLNDPLARAEMILAMAWGHPFPKPPTTSAVLAEPG